MKKQYKFILLVLFILLLIFLIVFFDFEKLTNINNIIELKDELVSKNPLYSFLILIGLYFIFSFLFLTIAPLSILSGILFNTLGGTIVSFIGSSITMITSFFISRFFLNSLFNNIKKKNKKLTNVMNNLEKNGKNYILFARLFFITPYNALNIISGISDIKIKDYIIFSILGCIPSTIFYAYCGSVLNTLKDYNAIKSNAIIISIITALFFTLIFIGKSIMKKIFNTK